MKERYDLYRYDLQEGEDEFYYRIKFYDPVEKAQMGLYLRMVKDKKDNKWKNYEWAWDSTNSLNSIVGDVKPVHVHKWGKRNEKLFSICMILAFFLLPLGFHVALAEDTKQKKNRNKRSANL